MKPRPLLHVSRLKQRGGFTLVELLVVMAIISIIAALSISAFRGVNSALNLSTATQAVVSELSTARQTALTLDETIQVRFYQFADVTGSSASKLFQGLQSFSTKDNVSYTPIDKPLFFPANIMISSNVNYSSPLATAAPVTPGNGDPALQSNGIGRNYTYVAVNFKSNGTIDPQPASGAWFITLYEKKYAAIAPVNFSTISVDSQNGRLRMFQP